MDSDYLEIFGGDTALYDTVVGKIQKQIFEPIETAECKHLHKEIFPNGKGYCTDCGISFTKKQIQNGDKTLGKCEHKNKIKDDNGLYICKDCNIEIEVMSFEPEWRYYGRNSKDPSRCHKTRSSGKSLDGVFSSLNIDIPMSIKNHVEYKYKKIVGNNTVRGMGRKAIIAACLLHTYPEFGEYRTSSYIRNLFGLAQKKMSEGLTRYYMAFKNARTCHTTPENLLRWILDLTGVDHSHYRKIVNITRYLKNTSQLLKRSSPQSVASAIIYFYLCLNPKYKEKLGLTKNMFAKKALLSDITVTKLVREAAIISNCMVKM